jgi:lysophospholipase L1-like esterase
MARILKQAGGGLLVAIVLFALIEGALRLGSGAPRAGFDRDAAYLIPDPENPGGWRTQYLGPQWPERSFPPKGERERVVFLGGSNVASFLSADLEGVLNELAGEERFEVLNLGCSGYGSERVELVLEQALAHLEPDVVVLYTGHNEFIEMPERHARGGWLARLRVVHSLARLLRRAGAGRVPEPWFPEFEAFRGMSYEETLERLERYRSNLRRLCEAAEGGGRRVVLGTLVYNHFSVPGTTRLPASLERDEAARFRQLRRRIETLLPAFLSPLLPDKKAERVKASDWTVDNPRRQRGRDLTQIPGRRPCSGPLAEADPQFDTSRWSPAVWELHDSLATLHRRVLSDERRERLEQAEELLRSALEICPDHPRCLFELGLVGYLLGRDEQEVARNFRDAARFERAPLKANDAVNAIVREVAAQYPSVLLFDAAAIFEERMPMGLVGWEWMLDHCHLNLGAREVLMRDLAGAILERWP